MCYPPVFLIVLILLSLPVLGAEYHVAITGDDAGIGSAQAPFRTVQKAAGVMQPGDTCIIHEGTYRETVRPAVSGEAGRPLRFTSAQGETVTISGADVLAADWSTHEGSILKAETDREFIQLFVDGRMMHEARWPNSSTADLMAMNRASAGEGTGYEMLADPALPPGDWNGARVLIWPGARWNNSTRVVTGYKPGEGFRFDRDFRPATQDKWHGSDPHEPKAGNPYILFGSLAGLDAPGEWFLDSDSGIVYLWPEGDGAPAEHVVEVKQRSLAFDLSGLANIELQGLRVFAAALNLSDARDCLVSDCHLRYVDHFRELEGYKVPPTPNVVTGRGNELRRCSIAYSAASSIRMAGEDNRLTNCIVHDVDYLGTYEGGVDLRNSVAASVSRCSLFRAGRDIVLHHGSKRIRIEYCDLYNANMLNNDAGAIYSWGTDGEGGVIAYNWVHDNVGDHTMGIYLDNFCKNFIVHHNVIWNNQNTGIRLNSDALNHLVCNNTITQTPNPTGTFTYGGQVPTQKDTRFINNLVIGRLKTDDPSVFVQGELGPEVHHNATASVDERGVPTEGPGAIDAGIPVPGITDGYTGDAPDLGAYERGGEYWVPGADWTDPDAPAAPARDLSYKPIGATTEENMIRDGLQLWLDANDAKCVETNARGEVIRWADKSGTGHDAKPGDGRAPTVIPEAINGKPALRGSGTGNMKVDTIREEPGARTLFIVSASADTSGGSWQRIIGAYSGKGDEWVAPNWMLMRPKGEELVVYGPTVFVGTTPGGHVLDGITLFGAPSAAHQFLTGDIAEVLLYDRQLSFDELDGVEQYLREKWGAR